MKRLEVLVTLYVQLSTVMILSLANDIDEDDDDEEACVEKKCVDNCCRHGKCCKEEAHGLSSTAQIAIVVSVFLVTLLLLTLCFLCYRSRSRRQFCTNAHARRDHTDRSSNQLHNSASEQFSMYTINVPLQTLDCGSAVRVVLPSNSEPRSFRVLSLQGQALQPPPYIEHDHIASLEQRELSIITQDLPPSYSDVMKSEGGKMKEAKTSNN